MTIQNTLYFISAFALLSLLSFSNNSSVFENVEIQTLVLDSIPLSKIDTIVSFNEKDCTEKTEIFEVFPNEYVEVRDTVTSMNMDTYEETVKVIVNKMPKSVLRSTLIKPLDCIEQIDTITEFNTETYEEKVTIIRRMVPRPKDR